MKKLGLKTTLSLVLIATTANAQQMTCYEYHYNSVPLEVRKQQAQSVDQMMGLTALSMGAIITASGVIGFTLVKKAYPAQDTATNLSTAGTAASGGVAVAGATGGITLSLITSDYNNLTNLRLLSDEAITGGETFDRVAYEMTQTLNELSLKSKNPKIYNSELVKLSMAQVLVNTPEICSSKDSTEVKANIWNATLQYYNKLSER